MSRIATRPCANPTGAAADLNPLWIDMRNIAEHDEKWHWIGFFSQYLTASGSARRALLGWAGSASVAVAIALWSSLTLLELVPTSLVGTTLLGLALAGFLAAKTVSALYPGGFGGLVDEIVGAGPNAEIGLTPVVDFIFANLDRVRMRVLGLAFVDLVPILLLVIIAFGPVVLPVGTLSLLWILVIVRLLVFALYLGFMLFFLSKPSVLRFSAEWTDRAIGIMEENPRLARIVLKFVFLERLGSATANLVYHGSQILIAAGILTAVTGSIFFAARLLLLFSGISLLVAIVWGLWEKAGEFALERSYILELQTRILAGQVEPNQVPTEYKELLKRIRVDRALPYVIPDSVWRTLGETPPES